MNDDLQAYALKSTVDEIKNACPDVSHTFIFKNDGTILARDENTDEGTAADAIKVLSAVANQADAVGGFDSATFYSANKQVNVLKINDYRLAMVGSEEPDGENSTCVARALVSTVVKLAKKISSSQKETPQIEMPEFSRKSHFEPNEPGIDLEAQEITSNQTDEDEPQSLLPEPPVTQFMVEDLGGLFTQSDVVRVETAVIQQWKDLYGNVGMIHEVELETLNGQTTRCKFKPIKNAKQDGKGTILLPQKIQLILQTSKGELIMVKPVIRQQR
jgi:hypothetical protein